MLPVALSDKASAHVLQDLDAGAQADPCALRTAHIPGNGVGYADRQLPVPALAEEQHRCRFVCVFLDVGHQIVHHPLEILGVGLDGAVGVQADVLYLEALLLQLKGRLCQKLLQQKLKRKF